MSSELSEPTMERKQALIVGCGYVGRRLARELNHDHTLYGLVRSTTHLKTLRALRVEPIVLNLDTVTRRDIAPVWYRNSTIFYLAPPPSEGESETRVHRFLNILAECPSTLVYLSTTGVYGDLRGALADESLPVNPQTDRARRRVSAEHITRIWCNENGVRRVVLRVPAIYGPGRLPLTRLRSGEPAILEAEAPIINRIHVDDLVQACLAAANQSEARGVYNVSDGNSETLTAFLNRVAALAKLPAPTQISLDDAQITLGEEFLSYLEESRRISNTRMRNELGVQLRYGDVDEGIRASLAEEVAYAARRSRSES